MIRCKEEHWLIDRPYIRNWSFDFVLLDALLNAFS